MEPKGLCDRHRGIAHILRPIRLGGRSNTAARGFPIVCVGHSLGAGVACLLALKLRKTLKWGKDVRYVGFEPPGGTMSKRLAKETEQLGWLSAVVGQDWISRLSVRAIAAMREEVIAELITCDRSKLQLSLLFLAAQLVNFCSCLRPVATLIEAWGGGPLNVKGMNLEHDINDECVTQLRQRDLVLARRFPEMWVPGRIVHFRPADCEWWCLGYYRKDCNWSAEWTDAEKLGPLILSAKAVEHHFPNIFMDAYEDARRNFYQSYETGDQAL